MRITKYEHACFVVDSDGDRLVVDPGSYTAPLPDYDSIVGVVVTHQHADHLDEGHLRRILERNPGARLFGPAGVAAAAPDFAFEVVDDGSTAEIGAFSLRFVGSRHAVIHSSIPVVDNVGVLINGVIFYPGDSFTPPPVDIDVLAVPASAPWLKIAEVMDYVALVKPRRSFATHEMVNSVIGNGMAYARIETVTKAAGGEFFALGPGDTLEV